MELYVWHRSSFNQQLHGVYNQQDRLVVIRKLPNDLGTVLRNLEPYREEIVGIVVESTYNWYWLVDGLMQHGYPVVLANPGGNLQYSVLKYTDDRSDCRWLAHLRKLKILATGYIYPKEEIAIRDLLRKRMKLVQQRTAHILSLQNTIARNSGRSLSWRKIEKMSDGDIAETLHEELIAIGAQASLDVIKTINKQDSGIEKTVKLRARLRNEFKLLKTVYGVGEILALTIMYETGEISRFKQVGNYCSYAQCVGSRRMSNGKKGENNTKNGNRYLARPMLKRQTSPPGITRRLGQLCSERKQRAPMRWRSKPWGTNWHELVTT